VYEDQDRKTRYIPAHLALVVKKLEKLNLTDSSLTLSFTLIIRVLAKGRDMDGFKKKLSTEITLRLNEVPITISVKEVKFVIEDGFFVYTVRRVETIHFQGSHELTKKFPFDETHFTLDLEFTDFRVRESSQEYTYRFNIYTGPDLGTNLSFKEGCDCLSQFDIAYNRAKVTQIADRKEEKDQKKVKLVEHYFPKMKFVIPLYREPKFILYTYMSPLLVIQVFTLSVLLQGAGLADAIANLSTIFLALVAYLPLLRGQIPEIPKATIADYIVYVAILQTILGIGFAILEDSSSSDSRDITKLCLLYATLLLLGFSVLVLAWNWIRHVVAKRDNTFHEVKRSSGKIDLRKCHLPEVLTDVKFINLTTDEDDTMV